MFFSTWFSFISSPGFRLIKILSSSLDILLSDVPTESEINLVAFKEFIKIGKDCFITMGANVIKNIKDGSTVTSSKIFSESSIVNKKLKKNILIYKLSFYQNYWAFF